MSRAFLGFLAAVAMLGGCVLSDGYAPDIGGPLAGACDNADSNPDVAVSFALDIRPLMNRPRGMAGCSCHTPTNGRPSGIELGGLDLGSMHTFRQGGRNSGAAIVVPGSPCTSVIVQKLSDTPPFGARMPLDGDPYLSAEEQQLIHDWIAEGALDN
ncbi:MAG: hypothetical protein K8W52_43980 [Deltaproteobacteria bacterium]|nr:hypothetical protein [Deltaproteobacteria bacterium]